MAIVMIKKNKTITPASERLIAVIGNFILKEPSSESLHIEHIVDEAFIEF